MVSDLDINSKQYPSFQDRYRNQMILLSHRKQALYTNDVRTIQF